MPAIPQPDAIATAADRIADGLVAYALRELTDLLGSAVQEAIGDDPAVPEDGTVAWDDLYDAVQKRLRDAGGLLAEVTRLREENARLTAELTVEYNPVAVPKTIIQLSQYVEPEWRQFYEDENGGTVTICSHPEDGTVRIFTSYRACRVHLGVVEALVAALREAAHRTTRPAAPTATLEG